MRVFVDTSAFLALLDADDKSHERALRLWTNLLSTGRMLCSNYVIVETFALVQRHLGMESAKNFQGRLVPVLTICWVDKSNHNAGMSAVLTASQRHLSLVDCISFEVMRQYGIQAAFTFDRRFQTQGFECLGHEEGV